MSRTVNCTKDSNVTVDEFVCSAKQSTKYYPRTERLRCNHHLKFCDRFGTYNIINVTQCPMGESAKDDDSSIDKLNKDDCKDCFREVLEKERQAEEAYEAFKDVMDRFDCEREFFSRWSCDSCLVSTTTFLLHVMLNKV